MSENDGEKTRKEVACEGQAGNDADELDAAIKMLEDQTTWLLYNREGDREELDTKIQELVKLKKEMGNKLRKMGRFDQAISNFMEAIIYTPWDAEALCGRALCYTALGKLVEGLKDAVLCLELHPTFVKGYLRKGNIEFEMKDYSKALDTYEMGKQHDDQNKEIHDAISRCCKKISSAPDKRTVMQSHEGLNETQKALLHPEVQTILHDPIMRQMGKQHDDQNKEIHDAISRCRKKVSFAPDKRTVMQSHEGLNETQKVLLDPEVQAILHDPIMRQILFDFQQNSRHAHDHAKNKLVVQKLKKLLDAGLL